MLCVLFHRSLAIQKENRHWIFCSNTSTVTQLGFLCLDVNCFTCVNYAYKKSCTLKYCTICFHSEHRIICMLVPGFPSFDDPKWICILKCKFLNATYPITTPVQQSHTCDKKNRLIPVQTGGMIKHATLLEYYFKRHVHGSVAGNFWFDKVPRKGGIFISHNTDEAMLLYLGYMPSLTQ